MNWEIEDPRWTAYLLGELSAEETAEAKKVLSENPQLQLEVDSYHAVLECLQSEIAQQALPVFDPLRKEAVLQSQMPPRKKSWQLWFPTAAAALLAVGFGLAYYLTPAPVTESVQETEEDQHWETTFFTEEPESVPMPVLADESPAPKAFSADTVKESESLMSAPAPKTVTAPTRRQETMKQKVAPPERSVSMEAVTFGMDLDSAEAGDLSTVGGQVVEKDLQPTPTPTPTPEPEPGPGVFQPPQIPNQNPEPEPGPGVFQPPQIPDQNPEL